MIGQSLSHYTILEKIGEGGMGIVYKAQDLRLGRHVAIKVLPRDLTHDRTARDRFSREARSASALDHPNIATIYEIDETPDGLAFIAMAYYDGETLKEKLTKGPLPESEAIRIAGCVASGLGAAHGAGIIHRDIKPANIIVTTRGEVKILDFGLAKLASDHRSGTTETSTGGTAAYMSPEQVLNEHVDDRSDLFSLGIVLYELLTGQRPFAGDHPAAVAYSILNTDPPSPSSIVEGISAHTDAVVLRLLQKKRDDRFPSAVALLESISGGPSAMPASFRDWFRANRSPARTGAMVILVVLIALAIERWAGLVHISVGERGKGVAVLGFSSSGSDQAMTAYCDGLTEIITNRLSHLQANDGAMWVVSTSEVSKLGRIAPTEAITRLGVPFVVTGSVHREGESYRLIVQLVRTEDGSVHSSREIRRSVEHSSQVAADVVALIAQWLEVDLSPATSALVTMGGTTVGAAYDQYVTALGYLNRFERVENVITATTLLQGSLSADSTFVLAHAALARAHWKRYDVEKDPRWLEQASRVAEKAAALGPEIPEVHTAEGMVQMARGRYEDAVVSFRATLSIDPGVTEARLGLARAFDELDDTASSFAAIREAITREPGNWAYRNEYGALLAYRGRVDEALEQFRAVVGLAPGNIFGHNNIGAMLMKKGRRAEAQETFERSLAIEPSATAYSNLGTILFEERRFAEAAGMFEGALRFRPENYQLWGHRAEALRWANADTGSTRAAYREAIRRAEELRTVNRRNPDLLHRLASYYAGVGDVKSARSCLSEAYALSSSYGYGLGRIAMVYEDLGERETALKILREAFEKGFSRNDVEGSVGMERLRNDERYTTLLEERKIASH